MISSQDRNLRGAQRILQEGRHLEQGGTASGPEGVHCDQGGVQKAVAGHSCGGQEHYPGISLPDGAQQLRHYVCDAVTVGKGVVEVHTVTKDVPCAHVRPATCAGNNKSDKDMFDVCTGLSIRVGRAPSKVDYCIESVTDIYKLLEKLI